MVGVRLAVEVQVGRSVEVISRCIQRKVAVFVLVGPPPVMGVNVAVGKGVAVARGVDVTSGVGVTASVDV